MAWPGPITAITLFVEDLPATKQFYMDVFALPLVYEDENSAVVKFGETMINLLKVTEAKELIEPAPVGGRDAGARMQFTLTVDDVDAMCAELASGSHVAERPDRPALGDTDRMLSWIRRAHLGNRALVPEVVRRKAIGVGAEAWLDDLPLLVAGLEKDWSIAVGDSYYDSTEAFVAKATCEDGTPAVLKLIVPRSGDAAQNEITVLRLTAGEGCARLLRDDASRGALLLERLGRSLHELALPIRKRHEILCSTATRVWRPAPDSGLPTGAEKGRWLADFITATWEELDHPCSERAIDYAARVRGASHRARIATNEPSSSTVTSMSGMRSKRRTDSSSSIRTASLQSPSTTSESSCARTPLDLLDGDPHDRARWLAARTGLDVTSIWDWGVVERVSTGLLGTKVGLQPVARQMLTAADIVCRRMDTAPT